MQIRIKRKSLKLVLYIFIAIFTLLFLLLNIVPGKFVYADIDGCACTMSHGNIDSTRYECNVSRKVQCGAIGLNWPFELLNVFDFR